MSTLPPSRSGLKLRETMGKRVLSVPVMVKHTPLLSAGENPGLFLYSGLIGRESAFLRKIPFRSTKPVNARKRHKPGKHSVYAAFGDIEEIEVENCLPVSTGFDGNCGLRQRRSGKS